MRIYPSPVVIVNEQKAPLSSWHRHAESGTFSHLRSSLHEAYFFHITVLLMPSGRISFSPDADAAKLLRSDGRATELRVNVLHVIVREISS
jgi:hypothetical protein